MPNKNRLIECSDCGYSYNQDIDEVITINLPCPECGSTRHTVRLVHTETIRIYEKRKLKVRKPGGGRPIYEHLEGDDLHRKSGLWMKLKRIIDRANDWYEETVIDPRTNKVIHNTSEPLSKHRGHGSDKYKKDDA